jgi:F-type H+-transporting ATPase subunit b
MLNQQWGLIFWTLITFGIALFVLWRFAFGPIQKIIDERRAHISESIETADETRAEAASLLAEYRETLSSVRAEAEEILERSRKTGDTTKAEILEDARRQAQHTVEKAQEQLERDVRVALQQLKGEIAGLTLLATEQVVGRSLDDDDHRRLIDEALRAANLDDLELGSGR